MEMTNAPGAMDNTMGFSYFGARYYDSDLSVWLSVDPMSDERSWISPYNYCQWNPVGRVDPSGALDYEPIIGENGDISYVAEKGDSWTTFCQQYGLTAKETIEIMNKTGIAEIKQGDKISGSTVKEVTGSEFLKLDWNSEQATDQRKVYHIGFALLYDNQKGSGGCGFTLNQYITGMSDKVDGSFWNPNYDPYGIGFSIKDDKYYMPSMDGKKIEVNFFSLSAGGSTYLCNSGQVTDGSNNSTTFGYNLFHPEGTEPSQRHTQLEKLMINVSEEGASSFDNYYCR